jgi:membrane protease subunit (stomatin/prohibitin family)
MARIFDVIEYPNEMTDELVHRFPDDGTTGDYRLGSNIIVRTGQSAVFFRDGLALDMFGPGRHVIATANIPLLTQYLQNIFTSGKGVFPAEVYFVSMKEFPQRKWGTPQPILVSNPGMGLGVMLLQGFGTYSFEVFIPDRPDRRPFTQHYPFPVAGYPERMGRETQSPTATCQDRRNVRIHPLRV